MPDELNDKRFWQRLLGKISRKVDVQDTEDALHSAYLRLHVYRDTHVVESAEAFLVRAARNIAVDGIRRLSHFSGHDFEIECIHFADAAPLQDEVVEMRARLAHVQQGLDKLPVRTRQIFEMHRLDNLKYREIAERLGISQSAVEKHIAKAALFVGQLAREWGV